jgi:hypothetical protein
VAFLSALVIQPKMQIKEHSESRDRLRMLYSPFYILHFPSNIPQSAPGKSTGFLKSGVFAGSFPFFQIAYLYQHLYLSKSA